MYNYVLTETCPDNAIVQHLDSGDYDYSTYASKDAAWEAERVEHWVADHENGEEAARAEFMATLQCYSREETLLHAKEGAAWPLRLGFALELVDDASEE